MNILFLHPAFPGQFRFLAEILGKNDNNKIMFATTDTMKKDLQIPGVKKIIITEKSEKDDQKIKPLQKNIICKYKNSL